MLPSTAIGRHSVMIARVGGPDRGDDVGPAGDEAVEVRALGRAGRGLRVAAPAGGGSTGGSAIGSAATGSATAGSAVTGSATGSTTAAASGSTAAAWRRWLGGFGARPLRLGFGLGSGSRRGFWIGRGRLRAPAASRVAGTVGGRGSGARRRRRVGGGEEGQLDLEAQAADAAPLRVDRRRGVARREPAPATRSGSPPGREPLDSSARIASITWSRTTPTSRPRSSSSSRTPIPATASPATSAATSRSTASASARPRRSRTRGLVDAAAGRREELVEHRLGVAHPAGGEPGDEADRRPGSASIVSASRIRASLPSISGTVSRRTS